MATFHKQSTAGITVELDEASLPLLAEADEAPDVRQEPPTACKHANALGPFRSRIIRAPHPAFARRDERA